jgi:hypothetical protein
MERKALIFMLMISLLFFGVSCFSQPPPDVPGKSITWHVLLIVIPNTAVTIKLNGKESVYAAIPHERGSPYQTYDRDNG